MLFLARVIKITGAIILGVGILACLPDASAKTQSTPVSKERTAENLYMKYCKLCHGKDGKRMMSGAKDLSKSELSFEERLAIITEGKGAMESYASKMNSEEIEAVAVYIEGLRPSQSLSD